MYGAAGCATDSSNGTELGKNVTIKKRSQVMRPFSIKSKFENYKSNKL